MNKEEFLEKFALMTADERKETLQNPKLRALIRGTGSNLTLYCGELREATTLKEKMQDIYVGLIERLNAKSGKREGIGAMGGLAERIEKEKFEKMSAEQQKLLFGLVDNVGPDANGNPQFIEDEKQINFNNVKREVSEELGNMGIYDVLIDFANMQQTNTDGVTDDNFAINIWKGKGAVWAINPNCFRLKTDESLLDRLHQNSLNLQHEKNSEAQSFVKMNLFEALKRYGNHHGKDLSEDGRNLESDYRYPHEWLNAWKIAADYLHDDLQMTLLATELQKETSHPLSFTKAAEKMGKDLPFVAQMLGVKKETIVMMENNFNVSYKQELEKNSARE